MALIAAATAPATMAAGVIEHPAGAARHRLTLVSAYSCTYCRVLEMDGMATLRRTWLPRGLEIETVPFVLSPTDIPASIAARCGGDQGFPRRSTILFRAQSQISGNWQNAPQARREEATRQGDAAAIARLAGIDAMGPALGLAPDRLRACLADRNAARSVQNETTDAVRHLHVVGTPTAFLDGRRISGSWPAIGRDVAEAFR